MKEKKLKYEKEFKGKVFEVKDNRYLLRGITTKSKFKVLLLNDVEEILDKHFVRKEEVPTLIVSDTIINAVTKIDEEYKNIFKKSVYDCYGLIEKQKVKDAIKNKVAQMNNACLDCLCESNVEELLEELGLE